jgi:hypothetical protein
MRHHHLALGLASSALLAAGLTTALAPAATASGAEHFFVPEEFDGSRHVSADDNSCGAWAATVHEIRLGGFEVLLPPGGQVAGEAHINGSVDGWIQLTPDDPSLPTYSGTYSEHVTGVLTNPDDDQFRVSQFFLRGRLAGTDGSSLRLVLGAKVTVDATGRTVVERSIESCG